MANTFRLSGTLSRLVPVRGHDESGTRDAYIDAGEGDRLRVRLVSPDLIEQAREHLHEEVVVTGRLAPAGVHQGPRLVEVVLAVADTLTPVHVEEQGHGLHESDMELEEGANEDVEGSWFDADALLEFVSSQGIAPSTLTHKDLRALVLEHAASSERVLGRTDDRTPDDVLGFLEATLVGEPWFEHAVAELLEHIHTLAPSDEEVVAKGVVG